eukprot:10408475-Prorocentrum_lima.AAC.1
MGITTLAHMMAAARSIDNERMFQFTHTGVGIVVVRRHANQDQEPPASSAWQIAYHPLPARGH